MTTTNQDALVQSRVDQAERIADMAKQISFVRHDASLGYYAEEMVKQTMSKLWVHRYPARKWINGGLIPINTEISSGALQYNYRELTEVGEAELVADDATDIPHAEITGQNHTKEIWTPAIMVKYSLQDIETSALDPSFNVVTQKTAAARKGWDLKMNKLIRTGQPANGIEGTVNHSGIIVDNAITGTWSSATPDQIIADVSAAINTVRNSSDGVEEPNTCLFPEAQWNIVRTKRIGVGLDGSGATILSFLRTAFPEIQRWDSEFGLKDVSASGGPSMFVYNNNIEALSAVFPLMMSPLPPQEDGLSFKLIFRSRYGGVMMPQPRSALRLDGI